jgi:hypothetical protein
MKNTTNIPKSVRKILAEWGSRGGKAGSKSDKQRAGRLGHAAMIKKIAQQPPDDQEKPRKITLQELQG